MIFFKATPMIRGICVRMSVCKNDLNLKKIGRKARNEEGKQQSSAINIHQWLHFEDEPSISFFHIVRRLCSVKCLSVSFLVYYWSLVVSTEFLDNERFALIFQMLKLFINHCVSYSTINRILIGSVQARIPLN